MTVSVVVWTKTSCEKAWPSLPVLRELPAAMTQYITEHRDDGRRTTSP